MTKNKGGDEPRKVASKKDFKWFIIKIQDKKIKFQFYFKDAELVSMGDQTQKDQLKIELTPELLETLVDAKNGAPIDLEDFNQKPVIYQEI